MKKIILAMCFVFISIGALAQENPPILSMNPFAPRSLKGCFAAGVNLLEGTDINNYGVSGKIQYNISNPIRLEVSADYFFRCRHYTMWDANINVHYLIPLALNGRLKFYPFVGAIYNTTRWAATIDYVNYSRHYAYNDSNFGENAGCGVQFDINEGLAISAEWKYQILEYFDQSVFAIGIAYKFLR